MQTGDKQTVTSPTETMVLRSAAVCFGLSHCCTVSAGRQHAFTNSDSDSHSRFPRSRHILRVKQTSTPSTRFHKSLVGITCSSAFSMRRHIFQVTFPTSNLGVVTLRATICNSKPGKINRFM